VRNGDNEVAEVLVGGVQARYRSASVRGRSRRTKRLECSGRPNGEDASACRSRVSKEGSNGRYEETEVGFGLSEIKARAQSW
jgi:hypothetical protein